MNEPVYVVGTICELSRTVIPHQVASVPNPKTTKQNINELYRALRAAKNKAEAGAAMRKFIVWNDIPEDVWDKLEEMFPIKR